MVCAFWGYISFFSLEKDCLFYPCCEIFFQEKGLFPIFIRNFVMLFRDIALVALQWVASPTKQCGRIFYNKGTDGMYRCGQMPRFGKSNLISKRARKSCASRCSI